MKILLLFLLGMFMPGGIYYTRGPVVLDQATVDALRAIPIRAEATADYAVAGGDWVDDRGVSWGVTRYEYAINIWVDGGGDAVLVFGNTHNPSLMLATVAYEEDGWHCRGAAIVARRDVEAVLR